VKDPRIAKLMKALLRRFPGTTLITGPMPDDPNSGEIRIQVLNAPVDPPLVVHEFAHAVIRDLWGDEPWPALVDAVNRGDTAKYYAHHLPKARASRRRSPRRPTRRRRAATSTRK
jgi:hypothetical protein